jgi:hypothetical protein
MADPVTLAMVGAAAGAALKPKDPLKGAMLGATVGFTGGTALGVGATTTAATGLGAGGTALPGVMGAVPTMGTAGAAGATGIGSGGVAIPGVMGAGSSGVAGSTLGSGFSAVGMPNLATPALTTGSMAAPGFAGTASTAPTFSQQLSNAGSYMKENPFQTIQSAQAVQGLLTPEQMQQAPMGQVQRGQPMAPVNFASLLNPQQYKPQPISLLG